MMERKVFVKDGQVVGYGEKNKVLDIGVGGKSFTLPTNELNIVEALRDRPQDFSLEESGGGPVLTSSNPEDPDTIAVRETSEGKNG